MESFVCVFTFVFKNNLQVRAIKSDLLDRVHKKPIISLMHEFLALEYA